MDRVLLAGMVLMGTTVASALLVPLTRFAGRRLGIMDAPGERKVHQIPTARTGGWAVMITFLGAILLAVYVGPSLEALPWLQARVGAALAMLREAYRVETKLVALFVGCVIAFSVGLADDILGKRFPVVVKLLGQIAAAGVLVAADVKTSILPYDWMNVAVTILWLVGITNAFNLLDNMDGLSGGVAFLAAFILLVNAWRLDEYFVSLILLAFMGSLLGFLFFNFQPASVFLGDCGSHLIGFALGAMTLLERYVSHASGTLFPVLMPAIVLAVPIVDTATVIIIRLREGRPIYVGDSRHLSHTLVSLGFSQRAAVLLLYLVTLSLGLGAVSLSDANPFQTFLILIQTAGFVAVTLLLMYKRAGRSKEAA